MIVNKERRGSKVAPDPRDTQADDLHVVGGTHELYSLQGTGRDQPRSVAGLGAIRNGLALDVTDDTVRVWWSPDAEVLDGVDDHGLAVRLWSFRGRVAFVVDHSAKPP